MQQGNWEYLVIGAGSAGCVAARRLADSGASVVLLEAGSAARNPMLHVPLGFAFLLKPHRNNWSCRTQPEAGLKGRCADLPRGRVLGGCSAINGMVYVRGQAADYDRWAALGNKGWSYQDVLPFFRKSEDHEDGANAFHGSGGPLWVGNLMRSTTPQEFPICEAFIRAAGEAGHARNDDINAVTQDGAGYFPHNIKKGKRWSSASAFLADAPANLTIMTEAEVTRILFENKRAVGVESLHAGKIKKLRVTREVILSAGAIHSPKLLELSGVGDAQRLQKLGISLVQDLPGVGENLHDHWNGYIKAGVKNTATYFSEAKPLGFFRNLFRYIFRKEGFLANPAALVAVFYKSHTGAERADAQIHFAPAASDIDVKGNMIPIDGVTIASCGLRPVSRGSVHTSSSDYRDQPDIKVNYLQSENDKQVAIAAFRRSREILSQPALKPYGMVELEPGNHIQTDSEILDYIARTGDPVHHVAGTCKMGNDTMAVVDHQLRVHGVDGLRVADASVMPEIVSGNTHAACVMIGERVADFCLGGS